MDAGTEIQPLRCHLMGAFKGGRCVLNLELVSIFRNGCAFDDAHEASLVGPTIKSIHHQLTRVGRAKRPSRLSGYQFQVTFRRGPY
jgi:hypothetical protein